MKYLIIERDEDTEYEDLTEALLDAIEYSTEEGVEHAVVQIVAVIPA